MGRKFTFENINHVKITKEREKKERIKCGSNHAKNT